jgi:hypothetical protein
LVSCRDILSVGNSANPDLNTGMGGHVTQHIYGMVPPKGSSQLGKTLFAKRKDFESAWRQYRYIGNPCNCGGGGQAQQTVSLTNLGMKWMDAYSCTGATVTGECDQFTLYTASDIFFGFLLVDRTWILNTCFPIPLTT